MEYLILTMAILAGVFIMWVKWRLSVIGSHSMVRKATPVDLLQKYSRIHGAINLGTSKKQMRTKIYTDNDRLMLSSSVAHSSRLGTNLDTFLVLQRYFGLPTYGKNALADARDMLDLTEHEVAMARRLIILRLFDPVLQLKQAYFRLIQML